MRRRSLLLAVGLFSLLACGVAVTLCLLVRYEPESFQAAVPPPGENRKQWSREFITEFMDAYSAWTGNGKGDEPDWRADFTEEQTNSYFTEAFLSSGLEKQLLPDNISQPRVVFEPDKIRLAFRYGRGFWSTVISIDVRAWVARDEANVLVLQLVGFHAGALPISAQSLLEPVLELGRQHGIDVNWYRHEGYPVALLRFQADQPRPTLELKAVQIRQGSITLQGRFNDGGVPPAGISANTATASPPGAN
jgi:hypothetical protein